MNKVYTKEVTRYFCNKCAEDMKADEVPVYQIAYAGPLQADKSVCDTCNRQINEHGDPTDVFTTIEHFADELLIGVDKAVADNDYTVLASVGPTDQTIIVHRLCKCRTSNAIPYDGRF